MNTLTASDHLQNIIDRATDAALKTDPLELRRDLMEIANAARVAKTKLVQVRADEDFLAGILTTALEGGIGYWCCVEEVIRRDDDFIIRATKPEDAEDGESFGEEINLETVRLGIERILSGTFKVRTDIIGAIAIDNADPESCDIDSEAADCIVQAGLLNEIRYG